MGRIKQRQNEQKGPGGIMKAVKYIIFVFTIIGLNNLAVAESSTPNPETETSSSGGYCQDCLKTDAVTALGAEIADHIRKTFGIEEKRITTRPVDVRRKGQEMLNAVVRVEVPVLDRGTGKMKLASGSGTLATQIFEHKPCIVITAKHLACPESFETIDGMNIVTAMSDKKCLDPKRRVVVDAGKTRDPLGDRFDFEGLSAQVVAVGRYRRTGDLSDWAVLKLDKPKGSKGFPKNFPRPMEVGFDSDGSAYKDLDIVAAGYPGYGGLKKLYADWKCKSNYAANYNTARVNCELDMGFSGGPTVAFTDSNEPLLVGINAKTFSWTNYDGETGASSKIVTFEIRNAMQLKDSDGYRINQAIDNIRCD